MNCPSCGSSNVQFKFHIARTEDETGYTCDETFVFECECGALWGEPEISHPLQLTFNF